MRREIVTTTTKMAEVSAKKYEKSRSSFIQFGKLLNCESCKELALNPHNLGGCSHTFCLTCTQLHVGKPCPVCKVKSSHDSCRPDSYIENLIEAYLPMAKFLSIEVPKPKGLNVNNNKTTSKRLSTRPTLSSHESNKSVAEPSPTISHRRAGAVKRKGNVLLNETSNQKEKSVGSNNSTISINASISTKLSASISKLETQKLENLPSQPSHSRKISVTESLDSSISGFSSKSKVDKRNVKGETALQIACVKQDLNKVKELLLQGADPNTQDNAGWTPLHEAVSRNNEDLAILLLDNGAYPNVPAGDANMTPLHEAVACKNIKIASLLVSRGADIYACNSRGKYPRDLTDEDEMKRVLQPDPSKAVPTTQSASVVERLRTQSSPNVNVYILNKDKKSTAELNKLAKAFGFKLIATYSNQVTHVAVKLMGDHSAIKSHPQFYSAVLLGHLIVDFKWIEESEKAGRLIDPYLYEIDGSLQRAPPEGTKSRRNAAMQLPGLFNNCSFYLHGTFGTPSKEDLSKWIKDGKGTVLSRSPNPENISPNDQVPYHANPDGVMAKCGHFIIYDSRNKTQPSLKYNMSHCKTLHSDWLISCIENFSIVDPF